ncbi:hypothetical protein AB0I66_08125 [Streptomyces sp. NPDC050439]|uniref:hypothetical protein n=1 Tax=unclassified Streptomyces TaxID=2593676 RepID=UPI00344421FA
MATRETRPQGSAVRTALFAMAFLFLVPLLGIDGPSGPSVAAVAAVTEDRGATAVAFGPYAERVADSRDGGRDRSRDGGRGCHEGDNRTPRGALPAPERTSSPAFEAATAPYEPPDQASALPGTSPPGTTSVDLYRTQVIRT